MPQKTRTLTELDFLLGIDDETRQGSLRFKENGIGQFLQCKTANAIPPLLSLPKLLAATEKFLGDTESDEDLRLLLTGGSSLGGARPKASVYDNDILSIAKFPKIDDAVHNPLWEALALLLAEKSGIQVPKWKIIRVAKKPVLLMHRFDRNNEERIPFISAMSMLGAKDNERHSYLEIAESIILQGSNVRYNLIELWKRMVFNICISNIDDHLRNHGFLRNSPKGWNLSPAYDMNPVSRNTKPNIHAISISENSNEGSIDSAFSVIEAFNINTGKANAIFSSVQQSLKEWKTDAISLGIPKIEIEEMDSAFLIDPAIFAVNA
jgi:serine/threonine-protein kinase HipA